MSFSYGSLLFFALLAAVYDLAAYRIPNVLVLTAAVTSFSLRFFAPFFACIAGHAPPQALLSGFQSWIGGLIIPLLLYPVFRLRLIGAGDIKLLCALGSFLGPADSLMLIFGSFLAGGILSLLLLFAVFLKNRRVLLSYPVHFALPVFLAALALTVGGPFLCRF